MTEYNENTTGTAVISIVDKKNDIYIVVCQKNQPGSHLKDSPFNLTGGKFGYDDKNPKDTALRALKFWTGLSTEAFPELGNIEQTHKRTTWIPKEQTDKDDTLPALGFEGQTGHDFVGVIKVDTTTNINELFEEHAKLGRSTPYLVNAKDLNLITNGDKKYYRYNGETNEHLENGQDVRIAGAFHLIEASVKNTMDVKLGNFEEFCNKTYKNDFTFSRRLENAVDSGVITQDANNKFKINSYLGKACAELYEAAIAVMSRKNYLAK